MVVVVVVMVVVVVVVLVVVVAAAAAVVVQLISQTSASSYPFCILSTALLPVGCDRSKYLSFSLPLVCGKLCFSIGRSSAVAFCFGGGEHNVM